TILIESASRQTGQNCRIHIFRYILLDNRNTNIISFRVMVHLYAFEIRSRFLSEKYKTAYCYFLATIEPNSYSLKEGDGTMISSPVSKYVSELSVISSSAPFVMINCSGLKFMFEAIISFKCTASASG